MVWDISWTKMRVVPSRIAVPLSFVLDTKTWQQLMPADGLSRFQGISKRLRSFCGRSFSLKFARGIKISEAEIFIM